MGKISIKKLVPLLIIIIGSGLAIFFEYQYGFVIPETLPDDNINELDDFKAEEMIYYASLGNEDDVEDWVMEGPGEIEFDDGWMEMNSPDEEGHHVFWCEEDFPESFIAQWDVKNLNKEAGLLIVFFAAKGLNGEDIFDDSLPERSGIFEEYTRGRMNNYHISYHSNNPSHPLRTNAHLRKNNGFNLVQNGRDGIPKDSEKTYTITLIKDNNHIVMFIDENEIINWNDTGIIDSSAHKDGKIGFRQMKWSHFKYRDFIVWELENSKVSVTTVAFTIPSLPVVIIALITIIAITIIIYKKKILIS